jgi:hypothetical protein
VTHCWQGPFPDDIIELSIHIHDGFRSCVVCLPTIRWSYITLLDCKILQGRSLLMTNSQVKCCGEIGSFISQLVRQVILNSQIYELKPPQRKKHVTHTAVLLDWQYTKNSICHTKSAKTWEWCYERYLKFSKRKVLSEEKRYRSTDMQ